VSAAPETVVRELTEQDREWAERLLTERWGSARLVSRGVLHEASRLPGWVALREGRRLGLATYRIVGTSCELVSLDAVEKRRGIGTALMRQVEAAARAAGCVRLWLVTTNDNLDALRFYQRRGFHLVRVHVDALQASRRLKPEIPERGDLGIPLRDELEMELLLGTPEPEHALPGERPDPRLARVCVFCGSSDEARGEYLEAAGAMGRALARRGITVVFGGGGTGLMGALADATMEAGGKVIGIIPESFNTPALAHARLTEMRIVGSMHERKKEMAEVGQAFIALPGGFGTFEELFEILTWAQIGIHSKPVGVLNAQDYFLPLLALIDHARAEGFIYAEHRALLACEADPDTLISRLEAYLPPPGLERWITREETS
jgi:uncharacterized protein (TIGR00730 family)